MEATPQSGDPTTGILDLNDECLLKVFSNSEPDDLAAVADVSVRLRGIAMQSAGSKFKTLQLSENSAATDYSMLRNFGMTADTVWLFGRCRKSEAKHQKRLIELVVQYCVGENIKLDLYKFDITDELAYLMLPLLGRVHGLYFSQCQFTKGFLTKLSLCSPELRSLDFGSSELSNDETQIAGVCQKFPKLEYIELAQLKDFKNIDFAEFLKQNPQLKKFALIYCDNIEDIIFQSIAKFVPEIEAIHFRTGTKTDRNNIKYLGQLRELKSLFLRVEDDRSYIPLAVHTIGSANIVLEHLNVSEFDITHEFIEGISKLHNLKTLRMRRVGNMATTHLMEICKHLKELSEFEIFDSDFEMNHDDLLKVVQTAEKLQKFEYKAWVFPVPVSSNIDVDTFNKLVKSVEQRSEKIPLALLLSNHFTADIPAELTKAASEFLTLEIEIPNKETK